MRYDALLSKNENARKDRILRNEELKSVLKQQPLYKKLEVQHSSLKNSIYERRKSSKPSDEFFEELISQRNKIVARMKARKDSLK